MKFRNGWSALTKQFDKIEVKLRISFLTLLELDLDWSERRFLVTVLNLTLHNGK